MVTYLKSLLCLYLILLGASPAWAAKCPTARSGNYSTPATWGSPCNGTSDIPGMTAGFTAYSSVAEEALLDLLRIGLNYYLQPDDAVSDATDIVTLEP